jgi:hypothetical protein
MTERVPELGPSTVENPLIGPATGNFIGVQPVFVVLFEVGVGGLGDGDDLQVVEEELHYETSDAQADDHNHEGVRIFGDRVSQSLPKSDFVSFIALSQQDQMGSRNPEIKHFQRGQRDQKPEKCLIIPSTHASS